MKKAKILAPINWEDSKILIKNYQEKHATPLKDGKGKKYHGFTFDAQELKSYLENNNPEKFHIMFAMHPTDHEARLPLKDQRVTIIGAGVNSDNELITNVDLIEYVHSCPNDCPEYSLD